MVRPNEIEDRFEWLYVVAFVLYLAGIVVILSGYLIGFLVLLVGVVVDTGRYSIVRRRQEAELAEYRRQVAAAEQQFYERTGLLPPRETIQ